jgi:sialic acid synthase SpsE
MNFLTHRNDPYFIAEIGSNHLKDFDHTLELINALSQNGVDAIKFQLFSADRLYCKNTPVFPDEKERPYDIAKKSELPRVWLGDLKKAVEERGVDFICTPFSIEDIDALEELDVYCYKVASSEINDVVLLKHIALTKKPVFLSVGMAKLSDIELAMEILSQYGPCEVVLLQCTALYPTPPDEVDLNAIKNLRDTFGCPTGFSDHSLGTYIVLAAVALGARVIEKHVTMSRDANGPDHSFATLPHEFGEMVAQGRKIKVAMGSKQKAITKGELAKRHLSQRSIVTRTKIGKGEVFTEENLTTKRPGYGLPPMLLTKILGHRAVHDIEEDEVLTWDHILA